MKILFVTDLYPIKKDSSIPFVVEDFALALKEYGFEVEILRGNFLINSFIRHHKIIKSGKYYRNGIKIYNKNFILPFLNDDCNFLEEKYDLIISHMPAGNIYSDLINKKLKLPHISIVHQSDYQVLNDIKYSFYFKNRLYKALKNSDIVLARNQFLFEKLNANDNLPSFVDEKYILQNKKNKFEKKLKLITLSKLIKRKNLDLVIEALKDVDFDYQYSIYGEGIEKNNLKKLIKKYNLENKIKIYSPISHNLIYEKLDEKDIFILPSINETFGVSYLEAMSRGLITIGTKNTGIDGVIKNNENGFLIEPKANEIKNILEKINKMELEDISKNTLETIKNYSKQKIINKYVKTIKKVLEK